MLKHGVENCFIDPALPSERASGIKRVVAFLLHPIVNQSAGHARIESDEFPILPYERDIGDTTKIQNDHRLFQWLGQRSEEHTSGLQSLMRISYAVFCLTQKKQ